MKPNIVNGNLLEQNVDVIVNPWNRNIIPWWLLLPQGVSGAIKKHGGYAPFIEISRHGAIPLGAARITSAGRLPSKAIIHVAGMNMFWFATEKSISHSVTSAIELAEDNQFKSIAFPLIGAGSGNRGNEFSKKVMLGVFEEINSSLQVTLVEYTKSRDCYCGCISKEFLEKEGVPDGYCGICERCGQPGHTQHFPGPAPYTGAWCDKCVKTVAITHWLKSIFFLAIPCVAIYLIIKWIYS